MKKDFVSVIIPVYNGEKYIGRCLESVINQSYKQIEIVIVNDSSKDCSLEIIKQYLADNPNITLINNCTTLGAAESRNCGLKHTDSEYVLFLDCDDWIDINCIEKAVNKFHQNPQVDIVIWEIKTSYSYNKISSRYSYCYNNVLTNKMALSLLSHTIDNEFFLSPLLGCKLIKKELIDTHNILFPATIYEDDMFTFLLFLYSKKIALITGKCLYYYQHPESLTHHFTDKYIEDFFNTFNQLYYYIKDEKYKIYYYKYLDKCLKSMINSMLNNISDIHMQTMYKAQILKSFYKNINIEEYYQYSFSLTI